MRKAIPAAGGATALVTAIAIAGATAAGPSTEHFSLIDTATSATPPVFSAVATGRFTTGGTATETNRPTKQILLRFPAGTITLTGSGKSRPRLTKLQTATACLQTKRVSDPYTIASGTGAYKGITGSGTVTHDVTFVEAAAGGRCAASFLAVQAQVTASGPVSLQ
jgi:hypothetical protein